MASKLTCPQCRAVLRSDKPIPAGKVVKCPRCRFAIKGSAQATIPAKSTALADAGVAPRCAGHGPDAPALPEPDIRSVALPAPSRLKGLALAAALVLLLGGGGGLLAWYCFATVNSAQAEHDQASDRLPDLPEPEFKPPKPRPLITLSKEDEEKVEAIIRRGVAYLKKSQTSDGSWGGAPQFVAEFAAMGGLTLLECGVALDDPVVQKATEHVRKAAARMTKTYGLALYLLFLEKLNDPRDRDIIEKLALRLVAGQTAAGGWAYTCPLLSDDEHKLLLTTLRELSEPGADKSTGKAESAKKLAAKKLQNLAVLRSLEKKDGEFYRGGGDNSNTQFALLALWAARRHKLPVERSLALVVQRFHSSQNEDGSWNYSGHRNASPLPTMTCAGLLGMAVGYGLASQATSALEDAAIKKALEHVSKHVGAATKNPKSRAPLTPMYFLWSVERVAVLYQLQDFGGKNWYHWGLEMLAAHQKPDGSWSGSGGHGASALVDTCFALLFLQRVNLAQDLTDKIRDLAANNPPQVSALPPAKE